MKACKDYQSTMDHFTYVRLEAPEFRSSKDITFDLAFDDLRSGVAIVRTQTKRKVSLEWLDVCLVELDLSIACYKERDRMGGAAHLQFAEDSLRQAKSVDYPQ